MEIVLEKDFRGGFSASDEEVAKVLLKLGADLRPGFHIEGVQICPMGRNVIQVTLNKNVDITRFCNKEVYEVKEGVRISQIRQSGRREVILTIKGLHPNTLDETVFGYLNCLGKVEKKKVILDTFKEGPLCGIQNGDRKYSVEFKADIDIGPLHVIDGHKVTFAYPGQRRTCFRCLQTAYLCPGKGVAKECEAVGGDKVMLADHLFSFWAKIGYTPDKNQTTLLNEIESAEPAETDYQIGGSFTPKPVPAEKVSDDKFGGVSVKWFPKSSDHGAIVEFLVGNGLPEGHENVNIKENGQVIISLLDPSICRKMMTEINGKKFNKKNIYCNGIVPVSPKKGAQSSAQSQSSKTTNTEPKEANPTEAPPPPPTNSTVKDLVKELERKKR